MPISKSASAVMTRSSYSSTVNTHVTSTATKTEKVNRPQNSPQLNQAKHPLQKTPYILVKKHERHTNRLHRSQRLIQ
ncbi:hypothetical protein GGR02_000608 [Anoxybacillus voinovskiensis]|uniref:Uncharacterized protein n=1 Tax=Anoxybacteroides voinovskiense TaxID=230470 RepID=A0A840DS15_9BACL|nr:hypothetical protein [Anoxybacillus voinovskiensis]